MSAWLLNLPVVWMSVVILGGLYLFAAAIYVLITALFQELEDIEAPATDTPC